MLIKDTKVGDRIRIPVTKDNHAAYGFPYYPQAGNRTIDATVVKKIGTDVYIGWKDGEKTLNKDVVWDLKDIERFSTVYENGTIVGPALDIEFLSTNSMIDQVKETNKSGHVKAASKLTKKLNKKFEEIAQIIEAVDSLELETTLLDDIINFSLADSPPEPKVAPNPLGFLLTCIGAGAGVSAYCKAQLEAPAADTSKSLSKAV